MARHSPLLGLAALGLIAVLGTPGSASASEPPRHRPYAAAPGAQANLAPVRQRAVSTALSIGGDALATASNNSLAQQDNAKSGGRRSTLQLSRAPTVQTAVSAAVSVGGSSATALAGNNGALPQGNVVPGGGGKSLLEIGRAPSTQTAVSTAVSIDGVPIPAGR